MEQGTCDRCEQNVAAADLRRCVICRSLFCRRCAVMGYGREFCSESCSEFFFHGEDDEDDQDKDD